MYKLQFLFPVLLACLLPSGSLVAAEFDPVAATNAYLAAVPAEDSANTNAYVNAGYLLMVLQLLALIAVAYLLLKSGWSRRWRELAERVFKRKFLQAFVYVPIYLVVIGILLFPLEWYGGFYIEQKFGLGTQTFAAWLVEYLLANGIGLVIASVFLGLLYMVLRWSPERWWMWGTGLAMLFMAFLLFLSPLYIDPVFNDYRPMDEGPLKERILSIARANGMQADDVKQVDQSRQTNRVSANVSGLFGTSRIALNDNLLNRAAPAAVEAVMAHEIGHYVLNHRGKSMTFIGLILLVCAAGTSAVFKLIIRHKGEAWGVRGIGDYAGLPLLHAVIYLFVFLSTPVLYKLTYMHEYEADLFAINATQNPEAWSEVALLTAEYRKLHPPAWEERWLNHHPSPYMRIYTAMRWKKESSPLEADERSPE